MVRTLKANEIECRVGQTDKKNGIPTWCTLLLYKDARVDYKVLDETYGVLGWKCGYEEIKGHLYCTISIYDKESGEWISKQNVGTETNTEAIKGEASDAFKRAAFLCGIGRELYSAPKIFVKLSQDDFSGDYLKTKFNVAEIAYDADNNISNLTIVDDNGVVRYQMGKQVSAPVERKKTLKVQKPQPVEQEEQTDFEDVLFSISLASSNKELRDIYNSNTALHSDGKFISALSARRKELAA